MKTDTINPDLTEANQSLIATLNQDDIILFDFLRKSMLEIFPLTQEVDDNGNPKGNEHFSQNALELAEYFAFVATNGISDYFSNKMGNYLGQLEARMEQMDARFQQLIAANNLIS